MNYYRLLQEVRTKSRWEAWILYMPDGVEQTSRQTTILVHAIKRLMQEHKIRIRKELPRIYSQDLLNSIFCHPYSKISFVERDLRVTRLTATRYLDALTRISIMHKIKIGRDSYYLNQGLVNLLTNVQELWSPLPPPHSQTGNV